MNSSLLRRHEATIQIATVEFEALRKILDTSIDVIVSYHARTIERWQLPIDLSFITLVIARVLGDGAIVDILRGDLQGGSWFEPEERSTNSGVSEHGDSCWGRRHGEALLYIGSRSEPITKEMLMLILAKAIRLQAFEQQLPSVPMDLLFLVDSFDEVLATNRDLFDRWAGLTVGQANDSDVRDQHG